MGWRDLISQNMQMDLQRRSINPGLANLSALIKEAQALRGQKAQEARAEASAGRLSAKEAAFKAYPPLAAQEAGLTVTPEMEEARLNEAAPGPTWHQNQQIESIKSGLRRGRVVIGRQFGEPTEYPPAGEPMNMEQALMAIQDAGLDPSLFSEELALYDVVERRLDRKSKKYMVKLRDGRVIWEDDKTPVE